MTFFTTMTISPRPVMVLVVLGPPVHVDAAVLGDHAVLLGLGLDHTQDAARFPGKWVPAGAK